MTPDEGGPLSRVGVGRRLAALLCIGAVLVVLVVESTQAHELTEMYGGFWGWIGLLLPVGALAGAVAGLLAYAALRLAAVRRRRRAIVGAVFSAGIVVSLAGGLAGAMRHDPVERQREAERALVEDCERQGGRARLSDLSCSFEGGRELPGK